MVAALAVGSMLVTSDASLARDGACCITGGGVIQCQFVSSQDCAALGGSFKGDCMPCEWPDICAPSPTGACCNGQGTCFTATEIDCAISEGTFLGVGSGCDPFPCFMPPAGACCLPDIGVCFDSDQAQCAVFDGVFAAGLTCNQSVCGDPQAAVAPGDCTGDGVVNIDDLTAVVLAWGVCDAKDDCTADLSPQPVGDRRVDIDDLSLVMLNWG